MLRFSVSFFVVTLNLGQAAAFPVVSYTPSAIRSAFDGIKSQWPGAPLRVAVWNAADMAFKPFLDVNEGDLTKIAETNIHGPFAFSSEVILAFKELEYVLHYNDLC